jgi:hypothetical protein
LSWCASNELLLLLHCCCCTAAAAEDMAGECLTLMVPYADLANHSFDNNSTFCMARDTKQ